MSADALASSNCEGLKYGLLLLDPSCTWFGSWLMVWFGPDADIFCVFMCVMSCFGDTSLRFYGGLADTLG